MRRSTMFRAERVLARRQAVDATIMAMGITFTVCSEADNIDRVWPFAPIPRLPPGQAQGEMEFAQQ